MEYVFQNERSFRRFCMIADKIEANPAWLAKPLANIDRWLAQGHDAVRRLEQWRGIIESAQMSDEGMEALLSLLRDDSEEARHLKSYAPMSGIITSEERRALIRSTCAFSH